MHHFTNNIKAQALLATGNVAHNDTGIIDAYDPSTGLVKVRLSEADEDGPGSITGWIPILSQLVGNGWGIYTAPSPGDMCLIAYHQGQKQVPIGVLGMFFSPKNPRVPTQSGEIRLIHESGMSITLTNDGKAFMGKEGASVSFEDGKVTMSASDQLKILSSNILIGDLNGDLLPLMKSDGSLTTNVKAS